MLMGLSVFTYAVSDTITDGGNYIKIESGTYSVANIAKTDIKSIRVISSTEVRIVVYTAPNISKNIDLDYQNCTNNATAFTSASDLESFLVKIWNKRYYHTYSYDVDDNLIQHEQYWIYGVDTTLVVSDTLIYDGSNVTSITAE